MSPTFYRSLSVLQALLHLAECACTLTLFIETSANPYLFFPDNDGPLKPSGRDEYETLKLLIILAIIVFPLTGVFFVLAFVTHNLCGCSILLLLCLPDYVACVKGFFFSKAWLRFLSMNCNCPCYRARPQLRFKLRFAYLFTTTIVRLGLITACLILRTNFLEKMAIITGISLGFIILQISLEFYHYRVIRNYKPANDNEQTSFSKKHKGYIPYHQLGVKPTNQTLVWPCKNKVFCMNRDLEHIMVFHARDCQPQPRWSTIEMFTKTGIYVGFHRTHPDIAVKIAHGDFMLSVTPPQMLGFGIHFVRSIQYNFGNSRHKDAFICAEIHMGKVKEVVADQLHEVRNSNTWWNEYDTIYYKHENELRDEFCIKSSFQIIRWVITIAPEFDSKVREYGLDTEFDSTTTIC